VEIDLKEPTHAAALEAVLEETTSSRRASRWSVLRRSSATENGKGSGALI
jgi:hypothetical protein